VSPEEGRRLGEIIGLLVAVGFLVTVAMDMFWTIPLSYLLILMSMSAVLSPTEEF